MSPATAYTFRSSRPVAEENAPSRIRPTCVQARPSCRPCRTKRELLFPRKIFSRDLELRKSLLNMYELHPALRLVRSLVKKPAVLAGVLALLVMFLLSACASAPEEGVVIDKPGAGGEP